MLMNQKDSGFVSIMQCYEDTAGYFFTSIQNDFLFSLLTILQVNSYLFCFIRYTEAQLLPPSAVKEEEIGRLVGQEELGIFQMLDKLEEVTEDLLSR